MKVTLPWKMGMFTCALYALGGEQIGYIIRSKLVPGEFEWLAWGKGVKSHGDIHNKDFDTLKTRVRKELQSKGWYTL